MLMLRSPLFYITCTIVLVNLSSSLNNNTLLLIVSFDGFRYDYFDRNLTNTLVQLRKNSSYPPYMMSVFPTKTFPNHFSIATGLYSEVHGVLDNQLYDRSTNKSLGYGYDLFHYNENIVPLWTLNERGGNGRRSGCMMYPGCNFKYQDTLPSHYMAYNHSLEWESRVDTLLSWFEHSDSPINFGMAYFEQPDLECHHFGPDSKEVNEEISRVDKIVQYLLNKTEQTELLKRLNIVFLSDHGGQEVKVPENIIHLDKYVNNSWYITDGTPPNLQIYPLEGKEAEVLEALQVARVKGGKFLAYTCDEMLERWHYKHCARTPPILLTADQGFLFSTNTGKEAEVLEALQVARVKGGKFLAYTCDEMLERWHYKHCARTPPILLTADQGFLFSTNTVPDHGTHGYDPLDVSMRGFFMATGPLFKRNHTIEPFENINIYPLAAHVLGLDLPELKPNGSLMYLQDILVVESFFNKANVILCIGLIICLLLLITLFVKCGGVTQKDKSRSSSSASYKVLHEGMFEERFHETQEMLSSDCEEGSPT